MVKQIVGTISGVISGYLVMAIFIIVVFAGLFPLLGVNRLFAEGTYEASGMWMTSSLVLGFLGAVIGGRVAALVGATPKAVPALAAVVLVLGLVSAVSSSGEAEPRGGPRGADASMTDAMAHARQPTWITLVNPVLGAVGVLLGGRRRIV